ncbi:myosin-2 [Daucus carota subsp. sativus]|uniref:myosin-2 n=1 Tax=Daucus carota subsp. sativus TaxID=79200 RepID=UPI0007F01F40|nr:PREDICTED: myosin-2-like isoform X1 [Daucus carota subsp. sativus]XP_017247596.1 PREDICTED: myosin-2-like isoform X1 [Daucus carota subsp. sativus]XP_017247597.1 PREDICTED: myosin-2-like isoform X1 [Daucus carota subsp. sativus]XP_017247598.1 PREDICTED: myosin-2-like isoform X1 [Daucus carota subsp. sativus]XP_017247599.1 PREDICTED: myosin-2-like isoform X1 [Daucus carota subsp. sativus]
MSSSWSGGNHSHNQDDQRSRLEEMLESLQQREESEKAKDLPPALPSRPTSRARRPSSKHPPPRTKFDISDSTIFTTTPPSRSVKKKVEVKRRPRDGSFGGKKPKEAGPDESPYVSLSLENIDFQQSVIDKDNNNPHPPTASHSSSLPRFRESELNDNLGYFIKKKLRVWCQLQNGQWESGQIQSTSAETASVLLGNGSVVTVGTRELLPANPDILEGVDDLIQLSYLNEPSVLHNLQCRYAHDTIYSKAGPVLIAINPFKKVKLYGHDYVVAYRQKLLENPHVYAIADTAYSEMMRDEINQSLIISGESGAGKTETAKVAMQYLGALGGGSGGIEREILQTSNILEAFGNAKTSRNDNSSRFGKLIEIYFGAAGKICGAKIQTFLLEKSRVVQLAHGERSYHIFYELCAGASSVLREKLNLKAASQYKYLNQSSCLAIHNIDDAQKFAQLMEALNTIHMSEEDQGHAFEMLAAVLWMGNISFQVDSENYVEVLDDEACERASSLLGCDSQDLMSALSTRKIQAGKDTVAKKLTLQQAIDTRDALAKFVYASLFDWLVEEINKSLGKGKQQTGRSISILDIYGFESFKKNSFEQFCINYANERLQQHFNRHLFKLQQEEYELDGIDWTKVEFVDNQECLDLFEKKPIGLISLLDEESNFPNGSDLTFANKLKQHLSDNPCFKEERGGAFSIRHYAGEVLYNTTGFLEKNRDPLYPDTIQLLSSCGSQLPHLFASSVQNQARKPLSHGLGASELHKRSVGTKFKGQLFKLMQQLENSTPHFIRCIKPNSKQLPGIYEKHLVLEQLRSCGVLEVVRISRSGYPTRITHQEFAERYGFLLSEFGVSQDPLSISASVLQQYGVQPGMYQVGYTKLYFRVGQIAALEETRKQVLLGTLKVQKCFRGHQARRCFMELKKGVITLQSFVRAEIVRREYSIMINLRQQVAKRLDDQSIAALRVQSVIRGWLVRKHLNRLQNLKKLDYDSLSKGKQESRISKVKQDMPQQSNQNLPWAVEVLQKRVFKAEAGLRKKEQENTALMEKVKKYEVQWVEYEAKIKSMEEMWQKQTTSLQMSLDAVKKSLLSDNASDQPGRRDGSPLQLCSDSEDTSLETQTPSGSTPTKSRNPVLGTEPTHQYVNAISKLVKEFEERSKNFDDEAQAINEVNSRQSTSTNPDEELRALKQKFDTWKKEYNARLRETKGKLHKHPEVERHHHHHHHHHHKWWLVRSKKFK